MPKFSNGERRLIKSIVAALSLKRVPEPEIIQEVSRQTGKTISGRSLYYIKQQIKKESYQWYRAMREGQYEYIHEFRERIGEIMDLQRRHYAILDSDKESTPVKQASMVELHRLNITLSNYFDVAPSIVGNTVSAAPETRKTETSNNRSIIV